ncbi:hypothetical protein GGI02_001458 [Coemansia sp. RSA 2322]|nr:hypothetical protein GGI02_001458 [Coemansia sp. RSA 2322]
MLGRMRSLVNTVSEALDGPAPTRRDRLVENWARIQEYYTPQRSDDLRRLQITDSTVPHHLECMLKLLAQEMLETCGSETDSGALAQALEFGPCVEYLLQYHVLSDVADFADADQPRGMRKYVLRFFTELIAVIPLGLLPESAIRLPLVAVMRQSLHVVQTSPTTAVNPMRRQAALPSGGSAGDSAQWRLGRGYHSVPSDRASAVLCHDLLALIVVLFRRLREHAGMAHLFFDWGGGEWRAGGARSDPAVASLRAAAAARMRASARGHELLIVHVVAEYLLAPGATGRLAREALVLVVRVLLAPADRARYADFLLDHARVPELLAEHLGYLHAQLPVLRPMPRSARVQAAERERKRDLDPEPEPARSRGATSARLRALADGGSCVLRSVAQQDQREAAVLASARVVLEHVDAFFLSWELLDDVARAAAGDARVAAAVQSQLVNGFLRTHIAPALVAPMQSKSQAITTVSYLTDLISVTRSTCVLDALFSVLLGADLAPERRPLQQQQPPQQKLQAQTDRRLLQLLSREDQALLDSIEDDALRAEAAALLLPPGAAGEYQQLVAANAMASAGTPSATTSSSDAHGSGGDSANASTGSSLRALLIGWMSLDDDDGSHLALNTLRLFDAILSTLNQFAYTSLVLRNFTEPIAAEATAGPMGCGGPLALGRGESVAADQELVRAVVERFLDAAPSNVATAMPEVVVSTALRLDHRNHSRSSGRDSEGISAPPSPPLQLALPSPPVVPQQQARSFQAMRSLIMREYQGCDEYVDDCLARLRATRRHIAQHWKPPKPPVSEEDATVSVDDHLAAFYPGAFLTSLIAQLGVAVKRHMAYNLMLTSMINKLACIADPALTAYLFLANGATMPRNNLNQTSGGSALLYDALVTASADAYVKSERVPRFAARLARQRREGVETAVRVGAAHPMAQAINRMDIDEPVSAQPERCNREDVARAVQFLKTPIKRFVHGYIVLDEFAKEMAATALALHTLELERVMDRQLIHGSAEDTTGHDEYADLLEYYDPSEPAYQRALAVKQSVGMSPRGSILDLGMMRRDPSAANDANASSSDPPPLEHDNNIGQQQQTRKQRQRQRRRSSASRKSSERRRSSLASNNPADGH